MALGDRFVRRAPSHLPIPRVARTLPRL